ncbi:hypothetical protein FPQ18DRAFT_386259 [Pyronema domesticum]|nr:hypothetical protein FPQ18DRAFT_386259 [Pyronema domesticum]
MKLSLITLSAYSLFSLTGITASPVLVPVSNLEANHLHPRAEDVGKILTSLVTSLQTIDTKYTIQTCAFTCSIANVVSWTKEVSTAFNSANTKFKALPAEPLYNNTLLVSTKTAQIVSEVTNTMNTLFGKAGLTPVVDGLVAMMTALSESMNIMGSHVGS